MSYDEAKADADAAGQIDIPPAMDASEAERMGVEVSKVAGDIRAGAQRADIVARLLDLAERIGLGLAR